MIHTIRLKNIHCGSCENTIKEAVSAFEDVAHVNVSIQDDMVTIQSVTSELPVMEVAKTLMNKGFQVVSIDDNAPPSKSWLDTLRFRRRRRLDKVHRQNCEHCKAEHEQDRGRRSVSTSELSSVTFVDGDESQKFRAVYVIGDMTCSACTSTVTNVVKNEHPQVLEFGVDLINKSGTAIIDDKRLADAIQETIRGAGYSADLVELVPVETSKGYRVSATIGGMTCASCSSAVKRAVTSLPDVEDVSIDVINGTAVFVVSSKSVISQLGEAIEDAGYDYQQVEVQELLTASAAKASRTVNLSVEGMFCQHCPDNVNRVLKGYGDVVVIDNPISLDSPFIKFTYTPDPPVVTIRSILDKIKAVSPEFKVSIVHPKSLEERAAEFKRKEQLALAYRLGFTTLVVIPTFVIGIIGMDLLPSGNSFRQYMHEAMWAGSVSRLSWALFFMATPVYFYGADTFHTKAIKEIIGLWRPGVPWKVRFLMFGSMNLLMSLGTTVAYFSSIALLALAAHAEPHDSEGYTTTYFDSVVFLTFFLLIGRLLDSYSKSKTSSAVSLLSKLRPETVLLVEDRNVDNEKSTEEKNEVHRHKFGNAVEVLFDLIEVGDFIRVTPGSSCAVDGIVFDGSTYFNESSLTGESRPIERGVGAQVFAGTVNSGNSSVVVKVTATEGGSLLDSIVAVVREGQLRRAPVERVAEKLTSVFVPIVTALSVITWVIWLALGLSGALPKHYLDIEIGGWVVWSLQFSITVFVIACPCGIGLAAPTALFVGTGLAAKYGILARGGGEAFQEGSKIDIMCFDKTGTLTEGGEPQVTDQKYYADGITEDELRKIAGEMESHSAHPLGTAIKAMAQASESAPIEVYEVSEVSGKGLKAKAKRTSDGTVWEVVLGNERLLEESGSTELNSEHQDTLTTWKQQGKSVIVLALKSNQEGPLRIGAMFAAADKLREESAKVIKELHKRSIDTWMISGDNETTAKAIASQVGIPADHVIAGVLPQEKADKVTLLQRTGKALRGGQSGRAIVAMVGDGVNDAPSLVAADVGIAIGSGSDIAMSSAEFVLLNSNLNYLLVMIDISRATLNRIKLNFGWALVYNVVGIPIAAGVIYPHNNFRLGPVWASLAMALSSVSVVTSSLLLKLYRPRAAKGLQTASTSSNL